MLTLLISCSGGVPSPIDDSAPAAVDDSAPGVEQVGPNPTAEPDRACSDLYDPEQILDLNLDFDPKDWAALEADYAAGEKNYHPAVLTLGDEVVPVQVRLKSNPNFSWFAEKMQLVIAFNQDDPDARFHGLRKLSLDASWYEPTLLRDRIAWGLMSDFPDTLFGACVNHARLSVNGDLYGFYTNIEFFDREWLERTMGDADATGTLWKYGTEAVSNEEAADPNKLTRLWTARDVGTLRELGDVDQWLDMWAAEAVMGDDDGYWCCEHNFYIYDHPTRGLLFVPWDFDDIMDVAPYTSDPIEGYGRSGIHSSGVFEVAMRDAATRAAYVERVAVMNAALGAPEVKQNLDTWNDQIAADALADPNRSWAEDERAATMALLGTWLDHRVARVDAWLACEAGSTADMDGDGAPVCEDPDDGDKSRHPAATETCNGVDDDGNGRIDDADGCDCFIHQVDGARLAFCQTPRTQAQASANCKAQGGALAELSSEADIYLAFFYTWPEAAEWWTSGTSSGYCRTWNEADFSSGLADCGDELRSICRVP